MYEERCTKETQHSYEVSTSMITKDIKLTNLMLQLEYETKCRPVHKRICHATVGYGYVHGEKIQLGQASVNPLGLCLKWGGLQLSRHDCLQS